MLAKILLPIMAAIGYAAAFSFGFDISSTGYLETEHHVSWRTATGEPASLESILKAGRMNTVRLRLWAGKGGYNLDYTLKMAQRFRKQGFDIFLDIFLSDRWADPGQQKVAPEWRVDNIEELEEVVHDYVKNSVQAFYDAGVELANVALGNEVTSGMLFPYGKVKNRDFKGFAKLWAAARAGVRAVSHPGKVPPKVMIQIHNGWNTGLVMWFLNGLFAEGTVKQSDIDSIGLSYYPFWGTSATMANLRRTLSRLAATYKNLDIYITETGYPVKCDRRIRLSVEYPRSPAGQIMWVQGVMKELLSIPTGAGLFYFEPAYATNPTGGSHCSSNLLFDVEWHGSGAIATALPSAHLYTW